MDIDLKAGYFNAVVKDNTPDRVYNAEDVNERFKGLVSENGVFATVSNACQVVPSTSGLKVVVKSGRGYVDNHYFEIESDTEITLTAADVILDRYDAIVIRKSSTDRNVVLTVKEGTLATNPTYPTITRTNNITEIFLGYVRVSKNATSISSANITDTRPNNDVCGWITGLINQMDTTTLFNQYQAAQNDFIDNQTTEFDTWFDDIKDTVAATSLYREYQAVYRSNTVGQTVITIPTSINYVHNGLDVLNVFINGMRLLKDVEYTINNAGTSITLTTPLDVATQDVEFVNKKSVSGTAAESVVVQVEALEDKVDKLASCSYIATGSNDNIALSNIVKNFLNGTGDYSSVADNASMKISVSGSLGTDTLIENQKVFDFNSTGTSNRSIILDFGNATINLPASPSTTQSILAVFSCEGDITIENANIKIGTYNATTIYGFHGGKIRSSKVNINNTTATTIYGTWGCDELSNSTVNIKGNTSSGIQYGANSTYKVLFNQILVSGKNNTSILSSGIVIGNEYFGTLNIDSGAVNLGNVLFK